MGKMLSNKQIRRKAWGLATRSFPKILAAMIVTVLAAAVLVAIPAVCFYFDQEIIGFVALVPIILFLPVLEIGFLKVVSNIWSGKPARIFHSLFCFTPKTLRIWGIMLLTELILLGVMLPWMIALVVLLVMNLVAIPESALASLETAIADVEAMTANMAAESVAVIGAETAVLESLITALTANPAYILGVLAVIILMMIVIIYMSYRLSLAMPALVLNPNRRAGQCIKLSMRASKRNVWRMFCNGFMLALPMVIAEILISLIGSFSVTLNNTIVFSVITIITALIEILLAAYVTFGEFGLARQLIRKQTKKQKALPAPAET